MKIINFITNYKNDSIFQSTQYGHYTDGYKLFKQLAENKGYTVLENQKIISNSIVIFRDLPPKEFIRNKPQNVKFVLQIWESALDRPSLFNQNNWEYFDLIISCNSKIKHRKHRTINYFIDDSVNENKFLKFNERKFAIAICSNRYSGILAPRKGKGIFSLPILQEIDIDWHNNFLDLIFNRPKSLYNFRRKFLKKSITFFELYGKFWSRNELQTWARHFFKFFPEKYASKGEYNGSKIELLSKYKFGMAFENVNNNFSYISEKIFECFKAQCVPVYSGCENIFDYIPEDCFVYVRKDENPKVIKKRLNNISEDVWNEYIQNGINYFNSINYFNNFSADIFANKLMNYIDEIVSKDEIYYN